ncbi:MAG: hypothetical protein AAB881_01815 [Patescibacteria group bacterium]
MKKLVVVAALLAVTMVSVVAVWATTEQVTVKVPATGKPAQTHPAPKPGGPYLDGATAFDAVARARAASADQKAERALARPATVVKKTTVKKYYRTRIVRVPDPVQKPAVSPARKEKEMNNFFFSTPAPVAAAATAWPWWAWVLVAVVAGLVIWQVVAAIVADPRWRRTPNREATAVLDPHQAGHWTLREFSGPHGSWRSATPSGVAIVESDNRARAEEARAETEAHIAMARNARLANVAAACAAAPAQPACRPCGGVNIGALYQGTAEQALAGREAAKAAEPAQKQGK